MKILSTKENKPNNTRENMHIYKDRQDLVIVSKSDNTPFSLFGDDVWDFAPICETHNIRIHTEKFPQNIRDEAKWLLYSIFRHSSINRGPRSSVNTLKKYFRALKRLGLYLEEKNIKYVDILSKEILFDKYTETLKTDASINDFISTVIALSKVKKKHLGFVLFDGFYTELNALKNKKSKDGFQHKQHPIIPQRILSELITQINIVVEENYKHVENLIEFTDTAARNPGYGLTASTQLKSYVEDRKSLYLNFQEAAVRHNLSNLFRQKNINNINDVYSFIVSLRVLCKWHIEIYSGMRSEECNMLKTGSLEEFYINDDKHYKFNGRTKKLHSEQKISEWITTKDILKTYEMACKFSEQVSKYLNIEQNKIGLFASNYCLKMRDRAQPEIVSAIADFDQPLKLFDTKKLTINEEDQRFLYIVDTRRNWQSEDNFKIGKVWNFTNHQFRRSLAFYAAQSGLVTLPSLKRQLQHINLSTTLYYSHSFGHQMPFNDNHISKLIETAIPEADVIAYVQNVLLSTEKLTGGTGKTIELKSKKITFNIKIINKTKESLEKDRKNGLFGYTETPRGICTAITKCDRDLSMDLTECTNCKDSIIKKSNLINVINKAKKHISHLEDVESFEYRFINNILKPLEKHYKDHY